jgi:hypothetical protein
MSTLVLSSLLYVVLTAVGKCDTNLKQVPPYSKESSTTFLRLTALRDDDGLWIARFGEYEVRIFHVYYFIYLNIFSGLSCMAAQLAASQEGLTAPYVSKYFLDYISYTDMVKWISLHWEIKRLKARIGAEADVNSQGNGTKTQVHVRANINKTILVTTG